MRTPYSPIGETLGAESRGLIETDATADDGGFTIQSLGDAIVDDVSHAEIAEQNFRATRGHQIALIDHL